MVLKVCFQYSRGKTKHKIASFLLKSGLLNKVWLYDCNTLFVLQFMVLLWIREQVWRPLDAKTFSKLKSLALFAIYVHVGAH